MGRREAGILPAQVPVVALSGTSGGGRSVCAFVNLCEKIKIIL